MNCLIVVNAYIRNQSQILQSERIKQELKKLGVNCEIKRNIDLVHISCGRATGKIYECCVYLDKDRAGAMLLEKNGVKLFNNSAAIEACDDKMLTHILLSNQGINMPDCVYAPLCYYKDAKIADELIDAVSKRLGFPLVAKYCYGSLGTGVYKIKNADELRNFEDSNKLVPHFYQKFIGFGGEDIRVIVIGGKYVCAMKRKNDNDFRSNIELGGSGENYNADENLRNLCEKTAKLLNLDYCGIDVLTDSEGNRYICEVNSNAFFKETEKVCGINVAKAYAEYIYQSMTEGIY